MKKLCPFLIIAVIGVLVLAGRVSAVSIPNPDPLAFGDDIGDNGIFIPTDPFISVELFDLGPFIPVAGSTFGFFFQGAPATLITIFDPTDDVLAGTAVALIDLTAGEVIDFDASDFTIPIVVVQDTFVVSSANIGFFISPDPLLGIPTLFTVPSLNPGGVDVAATFPVLGPPADDFLIAFEDPTGLFPAGIPLAFEFIAGVTPVPVPATFILLGSGLVGLALCGRKRFNKGLIRNDEGHPLA